MDTGVTTNQTGQSNSASPPQVVWGAATHVGNVRAVNEDNFLATAGMWVVADGMGGHSAGSTASKIVIDTFANHADGTPLELSDVPSLLDEANQEVRRKALAEGYQMMGTTVCGIALVDNGGHDALLVFNIGDSRAYEIVEGGDLIQLTTDHSYVQELVHKGQITHEEARTHPNKNVVSRAIGIEDSVAPDFLVLSKNPETRLLLCSDGVSGELEDEVIAEILQDSETPSDAASRLLSRVIAGPARDNATAVVLDVSWSDSALTDDNGSDLDDTTVPREGELRPDSGDTSADVPTGEALIDRIPGFVAAPPAATTSELVADGPPDRPAQREADAR